MVISRESCIQIPPFINQITFCLLLTFLLFSKAFAINLSKDDLFNLDLESLMNIEVVTASKKPQKASSSPLPVVVITESQIHSSGAQNIPELLRKVSGVDVLSVSASDHNVSLRGFNQDSASNLLVLIDGRSVFLDFYGIVLWDSLPLAMEEIKRIEIVKGPGSSIYGGNAFLGVVNIITKKPGELEGTSFNLSAGEHKTYEGSAIYGRKEGDYGYKMALSHKEYEEWHEDEFRYSTSGNFFLGKNLPRGSKIMLSGSMNESKGETFTSLDNFIRESRQGHVMVNYEGHNHLDVKIFWNGLDTTVSGENVLPANVPLIFNESAYDIKTDTYELEITKLLKTGPTGDILIGGNYRLNRLDSDMFDGFHSQDLYGLFFEDELSLSSNTNLTAGLRYDHHPLTRGHTSPRLGLVHTLKDNHDLRFSYSTAYGLPNFTQSYLQVERKLFTTPLSGNKELHVEQIRSWNLGYRGLFKGIFDFQVDFFHNSLKDLIRWPAKVDNINNKYTNRDSFEAFGSEMSLRVKTTEELSLIINYAYLKIEDTATDEEFRESPRKKFSAGLEYQSSQLFGSLFAHRVGSTRWTSYKTGLNVPFYNYEERVDAYTLVNMNAGFVIRKDLELSVNAFNLFDEKHREFCMGDELGRKAMAKLSYQF